MVKLRGLAVTVVLSVCALSGCEGPDSKDEPAAPPADPTANLVQRVHAKLEAAEPEVRFEIVDDRMIKAKRSEIEFEIALDNLALQCANVPAECDDFIDFHVSSFRESLERSAEAPPPTRAALRATLKNTQWVEAMKTRIAEVAEEKPDGPDNRLVTRPFHGDLHVVLVLDAAQSLAMVTHSEMTELALEPPEAFDVSIANLRALEPAKDVEMGKGVWRFSTADSYAAARVLLADRWPARAARVEGDLLVVAPSRDVVYFTGTKAPEGLSELRKLARDSVAEEAYPLSSTILKWTGEGWIEFR